MADLNPLSLWRKMLALPNESRGKTIAVAFLVSLVSAAIVSTAAVSLRPLQSANQALEKSARMDAMMASLPGMADILESSGADSLETLVVDLRTGLIAEDIDVATFDQTLAESNPATSTILSADIDIAGIGRRADLAQIFVLRQESALRLVILPITAVGYQSRIRALIALEGDLNTVAALTIIEQGETPGLGARIEDASWQDLWPGKQLADAEGNIKLAVVRDEGTNVYEVDGLTGATRTTDAVTNMVAFWMGEHGYARVIEQLRAGTF